MDYELQNDDLERQIKREIGNVFANLAKQYYCTHPMLPNFRVQFFMERIEETISFYKELHPLGNDFDQAAIEEFKKRKLRDFRSQEDIETIVKEIKIGWNSPILSAQGILSFNEEIEALREFKPTPFLLDTGLRMTSPYISTRYQIIQAISKKISEKTTTSLHLTPEDVYNGVREILPTVEKYLVHERNGMKGAAYNLLYLIRPNQAIKNFSKENSTSFRILQKFLLDVLEADLPWYYTGFLPVLYPVSGCNAPALDYIGAPRLR